MSTTAEQLRDTMAKPDPVPNIRLWQISDDLENIAAKIAENAGVLSPSLEAELEAVEGEFTKKVERVALYIRQCEVTAEAAKVEKERLARIQRANESAAAGLKDYLLAHLSRHGQDKVQTARARVSRVQSPASYRWLGDTFEQIPDEFRRTRVVCSLDTDKVKEAVQAGEPLPGGIVMERGYHIRIA